MLDSNTLTSLSNCNLPDAPSKAGRTGFLKCGSRRKDRQNGLFGRINDADNPKPLSLWISDRNSAFFQNLSKRPLMVCARKGRNVVFGKIDGGDFLESWNCGKFDGVGRKNGGFGFVRGSFEVNDGCGWNELLGKTDDEAFMGPKNYGGLDGIGGLNGGMKFARGGFGRHKEPSRKSGRFWMDSYADGCNSNSRRYIGEMLGKIDSGDSLKSLAVGNSGSGDGIDKDRGERDDLRLKKMEVDGKVGIPGVENSAIVEEVGIERQKKGFEFKSSSKNAKLESQTIDTKVRNSKGSIVGSSISSSFDFLELKKDAENERKVGGSAVEEDNNSVTSESSRRETTEPGNAHLRLRSQRQVMRRSNILAKQVISMRSALSLGFVSQLWVDTNSWMVILVEVRPSMLSGDMERFHLDDIHQVGDVVLVEDESVVENEVKMIGLDTLVGYNVATPGRRNVGKVRGYTFDINSGAVELLELDSFGISIIPSSLVSTYGLLVDDVLEVSSDTVVVHEDAISHLQRLTKGFWDAKNLDVTRDEQEEYSDFERWHVRGGHHPNRQKNFGNQRFGRGGREAVDDWDLPMDY